MWYYLGYIANMNSQNVQHFSNKLKKITFSFFKNVDFSFTFQIFIKIQYVRKSWVLKHHRFLKLQKMLKIEDSYL